MPRRVSLPGADELFRATGSSLRPVPSSPADEPTEISAADRQRGGEGPDDEAPNRTVVTRPVGPRQPTGRERHDEKITVYVSPSELVDLEHARLALRAEHQVVADRGRIVREALAVMLADLDAKGESSILVRRLRQR